MDRERYYVNLNSRNITKEPYGSTGNYIIYASKEEVGQLRAKMNEMYDSDFISFWRAHVPFVPYHLDTSNDTYDANINEAFQMVYDLGEEETKAALLDMGVLQNRYQ